MNQIKLIFLIGIQDHTTHVLMQFCRYDSVQKVYKECGQAPLKITFASDYKNDSVSWIIMQWGPE